MYPRHHAIESRIKIVTRRGRRREGEEKRRKIIITTMREKRIRRLKGIGGFLKSII